VKTKYPKIIPITPPITRLVRSKVSQKVLCGRLVVTPDLGVPPPLYRMI
jgi:hypothetical protein